MRPRILVVEDEAAICMDLAECLERLGYDVVGQAASATEALDLIARQSPDLVLMDIRIEGPVDGIQTALAVRKRYQVPVIFLTAYADEKTLARARQASAYGYLIKPYQERLVRAAIEMALERHREDRALAESERWLTSLLGSMGDAVLTTDLHGQVTYLNHVGEQITGWSCREARGKPLGQILPLLDYRTRQPLQGLVERILSENRALTLTGPMEMRDREGIKRLIEDSAAPLRSVSGTPVGIVFVFREVTEQHQQNEWRRHLEKKEAIGLLAGGMAHELNNILQPIHFAVDLLRPQAPPEADPMLDVLTASVSRAAELIRQMVTYTRGRPTLPPGPLELLPLLQESVQVFRQILPANIAVALEVPVQLPAAWAEPSQLHQVLMNLVLNARDAMPEGGQLTLSASEVTITDAARPAALPVHPGQYACLTVSDTGSGMSPEQSERIFEPFYTTKPVGEGQGLGLATSQGIIQNLGGFMEVDSVLGQGTHMRVYLQTCNTPTTVPAPAPPIPIRQGHNELLLLVDDEQMARQLARETLAKQGYRILEASGGDEALALYLLHGDEIRLVISDLIMSDGDGIQLLSTLRSLNPDLPTMVLTGVPCHDGLKEPDLANLPVVAKPYTIRTLLAEVSRALEPRNGLRAAEASKVREGR